jgi:transposase
MEHGYRVHLANTAAIQQYEGLKYTDDNSDARWLAHMLRLGVLPQGHIYPKQERPIRDLLRKRSQMVRQRTTNVLSIENLLTRNTGTLMSANRVKVLDGQHVDELVSDGDLALAVKANLSVMQSADEQVEILERTVTERVKLRPEFCFLKSVPGIGQILALTIMLETGDIRRFPRVGNTLRIVGMSGVRSSVTANAKGAAIPRTGISI